MLPLCGIQEYTTKDALVCCINTAFLLSTIKHPLLELFLVPSCGTSSVTIFFFLSFFICKPPM